MAKGSLGRGYPMMKAANKIAVFDTASNPALEFIPTFTVTGVNFANYSDNHVRIVMTVSGADTAVLLPPNASESYDFARGVIGKITLVAVAPPVKAGGGIIDASETVTVATAEAGYVDVNLIQER